MKQIFTFFFLALFAFAGKAQNVLIRDSTSESQLGQAFTSYIHKFIYNNNCQVAIDSSNNQEFIYTYYPNGQVHSETFKNYDTTTKTFYNRDVSTSIYNAAGKLFIRIDSIWVRSLSLYKFNSKDSDVYDNNNFLIQIFHYVADSANGKRLQYEQDFTNDSEGKTDSTTEYYYQSPDSVTTSATRLKFFYFDSSKRSYRETQYNYQPLHQLVQFFRSTVYHDSANYVSKDSTILEFANSDSTVIVDSTLFVAEYIYNTDRTIKEEDSYYNDFAHGNINIVREYYTYAPCTSSILAVRLLNFTGRLQGDNTLLQWQTTSEVNTSYFNIQRSIDGVHFTTINKTTAAGNSASTKNYSYTDVNAAALHSGKLYYRLKEVDKDGKFTYSNIVSVDFVKNNLFTISPNPAKDHISITSSAVVSDAQITITSANGRTLYASKHSFTSGEQLNVPVAAMASQTLFVTINTSNGKQEFKVVKE